MELIVTMIIISILVYLQVEYGFIFFLFKMSKRINQLDISDAIIEDHLVRLFTTKSIATDIKGYEFNVKYYRIYVRSIVLTPKYLIIRNSVLTYHFNINRDSFVYYSVKTRIIGFEVTIHLNIDNEKRYFKFRTKRIREWMDAFKKIELSGKV